MKVFFLLVLIIFAMGLLAFLNELQKSGWIDENLSLQEEPEEEKKTEENQDEIEITGSFNVDEYIREKARARGYKLQPIVNEDDLVLTQNQKIHKEALNDLIYLQEEMKSLGMNLTFISGYRSVERQREIFLQKLGEIAEGEILSGQVDGLLDSVLSKSSIPGYSKHHSGKAIDIGCNNYILDNSFKETDCYKWLSENNFENANKYKFYPSYPSEAKNQGPDPEPWEFVWGIM